MKEKNTIIEVKVVKINDIKSNPNNPRIIKDDKFKKLVESIKGFPEMANVRPIVVNTDMIVLGGNMRLKAMKEAGWKDAPIQIVDWDEQKQKEFIVKDNVGFGEWDWDILANEWDNLKLEDWGLDTIKHNWDSLDYIDEQIATPKLNNDNELVIIITNEWLNDKKQIEDEVRKLLSEKYSGCDIK
jgi:hypothetical protein